MLTPELAVLLEELGFGTLWVGGSPPGDLELVEGLLAATTRLTLATSIVNMWQVDAHLVAASFHRIEDRYPGRFVLGAGAGHPEATQEYARPFDMLAAYVDTLLADGVPRASLVLAALGPRVLRLAAERTAGAIPYLVTPEYTRQAREVLGAGPLLAPEQKVVLDTDPDAGPAPGPGPGQPSLPGAGQLHQQPAPAGLERGRPERRRQRRARGRAGRLGQRREGGRPAERAPSGRR